MYTVVRFFPCPTIHSTRSWDWSTVSSASTRTASRSPEISVADIGDQDGASAPGARPPECSGSDGATWTSQLSDVEASVIGESVGGLGRRSHQRGPRRTYSSCWRVLIPSLVKTLCRGYSTGLRLTNSRVAM